MTRRASASLGIAAVSVVIAVLVVSSMFEDSRMVMAPSPSSGSTLPEREGAMPSPMADADARSEADSVGARPSESEGTERATVPPGGDARGELESDLQRQLEETSRRYLALRTTTAKERIDRGLAVHSSSSPTDPGLAEPPESPDIEYLHVTDSAGHHLVELGRVEYPELFALKDRREELRARLEAEAGATSGIRMPRRDQ
jgi:hypothetical protein